MCKADSMIYVCNVVYKQIIEIIDMTDKALKLSEFRAKST